MIDLKRTRGFTLLEVLIVLVILAVLAGLAVPAYTSAVEKSRKQEALQTLGAVRGSQQRYYAQNSSYSANFANLDFDPNLAVAGNTPHYAYALAGGGATYTCTATRNAVDRPAGIAAYTVTINEMGVITSTY
jgi:type IV pilus assembly protein PilE